MSIKELFDKGHSLKFVKNKTQNDLAENVESSRYVDAYAVRRNRFIPDVDFATASNFARFGLAEEYYDTAIKRIYQTYPYDGSQAEKIEWENNSTYLDLFLFENEYPRTNGFVTFNSGSDTYTSTVTSFSYSSSAPQYISFKGGPHADPGGDYKSEFSAGPSKKGVSKANIYHTGSQRTNNLELDLDKGVTVEFWMKKDGPGTATSFETIFDNVSLDSLGVTTDYLTIRLINDSGGTTEQSIGVFLYTQAGFVGSAAAGNLFTLETGESITDGNWKHYAITLKNEGSDSKAKLYLNGVHKDTDVFGATYPAASGTMVAALGAHAGTAAGSHAAEGWGNIKSASFDEFRYWKTARNAQQIGRFYRDQIGGGTNTDNVKHDDVSNYVDLGVYYKFNEGITGDTTTDATILDYSGRITNGTFVNYSSSESRNVGSAIVLSEAATREFKDPIIYSYHPSVIALAEAKQLSGSVYDHENVSSIYKTFPGWIAENDEKESNNLKYLSQIIASYFDDLFLQIQKLPRLKDINYPDDTSYEKPLPFAERLLSSAGYDPPELFADVSDLAKYLERDEKILFEKKLYEVKNIIYQNIYNNLSFIQKSKGTFKSLRNFLRCFGVDEELIKLNIYSNNDVYEFKDNVTHTAIRKKYLDFDDFETRQAASDISNSYTATAYQYYDSANDSANSLSYIPPASNASGAGAMMTIETEVIFPKRSIVGDANYQMFPALTSSIFGLHAVEESNTDLTFDSSDTINFNIVAIKPDNDLRNVRFAINSSGSSVFSDNENTSSFLNVYDNEKWNFAFRLRPTKAKTDTGLQANTGSGYLEPAASAYTYELYGVNYLSHILQNEFTLSGTMSLAEAETFFTKPKRIFLGAARTNFTGSIERYSDVKVSSTRVWLDYLSNETIRAHARDANSYGALQPYRNANDSLNTYYVPQISTLILNWTMDNVTGSTAAGQFLIEDFASGSMDNKLKFGDSWAQSLSKYNYSGLGDKFVANNSYKDQAVDVEFVQSGKLKLPEIANSDDMVKILNKQDDVVFTRDTTYVQHVLSVEKSMYQIISEEMLRMFATIVDFNNLVGEPVNRYRSHYKRLEKLRELFFESVESDILDLDKFIEYFKWIDDAVSIMISQLIPVSSNSTELLRNMVESHILERNKYWTKFPTLEIKNREPISSLKAIEELKYNWKFGHAPLPDTAATATITITAYTELNAGDKVNLVATDGTNYDFTQGDQSSVNGTFEATDSNDQTATNLMNVINTSSGPSGTRFTATVDGAVITVTQATAGAAGDTTVTLTDSGTAGMTKTNFTGGSTPPQNQNCLWWKQRAERSGVLTSGDTNVDSNKDSMLKIAITEVSGTEPTLQTIAGARYAGTHYNNRSLARPIDLLTRRSLKLKGGSNPQNNNIHDYYKGAIKWGSDDDFIYLDIGNKVPDPNCSDQGIPPELNKKKPIFKALTMTAHETINSNASGSGKDDQKYSDARSTLLLPFSIHSSSVPPAGGYQALYSDQFKIDFTNVHDDKYGPSAEIPLQGPFTQQHVGGSQHRHVSLNRYDADLNSDSTNKLDYSLTRAEGWFLQEFLNTSTIEYILGPELFSLAPSAGTTDTAIIDVPPGSAAGDPSPYEYWTNGAGIHEPWTFIEGPTPTPNTGPSSGKFAYCDVPPSLPGEDLKVYSLVTPLIDILDVEGTVYFQFYYHMFGVGIGTLQTQASLDPTFQTGVEDIQMRWDYGGVNIDATSINGAQQAAESSPFKLALAATTSGLTSFKNKRFYIRFLYTAGGFQESDCAIDDIRIYKGSAGVLQDSFKLFSPTHDNHHRPRAIYTRDTIAKRPVNIRNIHMTGNSPTVAGNYLDRYEYVSTTSPEANDPYFVKNVDKIINTNQMSMPGSYIRSGSLGKIKFIKNATSLYDAGSIEIQTADGHHIIYKFDDDNVEPATGECSLVIDGQCRAVSVQINGLSDADDIADQVKLAIESLNGHGGRLIVEKEVFEGQTFLILKQRTGNGGSITWSKSTSTMTVTDQPSNVGQDTYLLPNRDYLTGSIRNRTRFKTRFSAPGGYEVMSRGFLDSAHEIYSAYNAMPWRNNWGRKVYNSQLQAHMGQFGVSTHGPSSTSARVYGEEVVGSIRSDTYMITGDAAVHKRHRNNIERYGYTGDRPNIPPQAKAVASVTIANYSGLDTDDKVSLTDVSGATYEYVVGTDFAAASGDEDTAANLNTAINAGGKFTSEVVGDKVTITQKLVGKSGNTTVVLDGDGSTSGYWAKEGFTGGSDGPGIFTKSSFDNAFVSHMIPRTENQSRWITASLI